MVNFRNFAISDQTFSHFTTKVDIDEVENIDDVIKIIVNNLMNILKKHNFTNLMNILQNNKYHIHDYSFEDVLLSDNKKIYYICNNKTC